MKTAPATKPNVRTAAIEDISPVENRESAIQQTLSHSHLIGMGVPAGASLKETYPEVIHPGAGKVMTRASSDAGAVTDWLLQAVSYRYYQNMQEAFEGICNPMQETFGKWASTNDKQHLANILRGMGFDIRYAGEKTKAEDYAPPECPHGNVSAPVRGPVGLPTKEMTKKAAYGDPFYEEELGISPMERGEGVTALGRPAVFIRMVGVEAQVRFLDGDEEIALIHPDDIAPDDSASISAKFQGFTPMTAKALREGYELGLAASTRVKTASEDGTEMANLLWNIEGDDFGWANVDMLDRPPEDLLKATAVSLARSMVREVPELKTAAKISDACQTAFEMGVDAGIVTGLRTAKDLSKTAQKAWNWEEGTVEADAFNVGFIAGFDAAKFSGKDTREACFAEELEARNLTPFEFTAHKFSSAENSEALWSAYEAGVSAGIDTGLEEKSRKAQWGRSVAKPTENLKGPDLKFLKCPWDGSTAQTYRDDVEGAEDKMWFFCPHGHNWGKRGYSWVNQPGFTYDKPHWEYWEEVQNTENAEPSPMSLAKRKVRAE